jgi:hypothetical protein
MGGANEGAGLRCCKDGASEAGLGELEALREGRCGVQ